MVASASTDPLSDHDLYDHFRDRGLSHADAVKHIELRRTAGENATIQNPADSADAAVPNPWLAAPVAFGQGASLGAASKLGDLLPGPSNTAYLHAAHQAYPWTMGAADAVGGLATGVLAGPLVKGLSAAKGAAVLGGLEGTARGALEPKMIEGLIPGLTRTESALAMGVGGAIAGSLGGKLVSKLLPIGATVAKNTLGLLRKFVPGLAKREADAMAETAFRTELERLNVHPKMVERTVAAWKTGKVPQGAIDLPPMEPTVSRVGETITPLEPQLPTLRAQADVMATQPAYVRAGNPNNLPTGTGPMAPPQAGMPLGVPGTLQALEQHLGRPLTPPEAQSALERLLGPQISRPGHPIWYGKGHPTP